MPLATKKLVVYIDQHILSNIVKAKERKLPRPDLVTLFEVLTKGMHEEKLVCPRSWFHRVEGSLAPTLDKDIQRYLRYISQIDFEPPFELEKRQFFNAACRFLGIDLHYTGWRECFESDPDGRLRRFILETNMPMDIFNFSEQRQTHADALNRARQNVKGAGYAEQLSLERADVPAYLDGCYGWQAQQLFADRADGRARYEAFLATNLASSVIALDLSTQLWASLLVRYNDREVKTSDATDVQILSNLLPYCHVMTTDRFMKELVRILALDQRFGVRVFSGTEDDIAALTDHVKELLEGRSPANVPRLSLLVVPDAEIKPKLWEFFRALMRGVNRWGSKRNEWIELVNVNDGGYPSFMHARSGLTLPDASFFFEFDDEIRSEGRDPIDIARDLRGAVAVVVDSYHKLSREFVDNVFKAVESGADSVPQYGWPIVRRVSR